LTEHEARIGNTPRFCKTGISVQTSLRGIANKAKEKPEYRFRNLYGMIDEELLRLAWGELNKKAVAGVDRVTAQEYGKDLKANLDDLIDRLKRNGYRAKLVKRTLIPKGDGATRALGIPALEDRLLQKAVSLLLEAVYEPTFLDSSYGYRPGRDAKTAVNVLRNELNFGGLCYVVEADIKGFFDNLDHDQLIKMLEHRIDDQKLLRLIRKWLNAGILDPTGKVINPLTGTPQGGIVSPILANVYLHYALDLWVENVVGEQIKGKLRYVRYADDLVCAFRRKDDAERFYRNLGKRLAKFNLKVAEEKTRIVCFDPYNKELGSFDFLGFELVWGKSRLGLKTVKRLTARKRLRKSIKAFTEWLKQNRSLKLADLIVQVNDRLRGHYGYFGVIGNSARMSAYRYHVTLLLFKWLNRRSQKRSMTWPMFTSEVSSKLLTPKIVEKRALQRNLFGIQR
jgi:RNA-directed DNA polymerase